MSRQFQQANSLKKNKRMLNKSRASLIGTSNLKTLPNNLKQSCDLQSLEMQPNLQNNMIPRKKSHKSSRTMMQSAVTAYSGQFIVAQSNYSKMPQLKRLSLGQQL